jgi:hypothetical protein
VSYIDQLRGVMAECRRPASRTVLLALWARANWREESPVVWPGLDTIAADACIKIDTARRCLAELERIGAIERSGDRVTLIRRDHCPINGTTVPGPPSHDGTTVPRNGTTVPSLHYRNVQERCAHSGSWAGVVQHANELASRYDLAMIRDLATPPKGLIELLRQTDAESIKAMLTEYAEICRAKPDQSRWWGRYRFTSSTWAAIEPMAIARRKAHQQAQGASLPTQNRSRVL